jgi:hypothetical protein
LEELQDNNSITHGGAIIKNTLRYLSRRDKQAYFARTRPVSSSPSGISKIDGIPGILLDFIGSGGSVKNKLLPTGKVRGEVKFPTLGNLETRECRNYPPIKMQHVNEGFR